MSRCLKWVAVKDGEPILCVVRATPWAYPLRPVRGAFFKFIFLGRLPPVRPRPARREPDHLFLFLGSSSNWSPRIAPGCGSYHTKYELTIIFLDPFQAPGHFRGFPVFRQFSMSLSQTEFSTAVLRGWTHPQRSAPKFRTKGGA